jgi:CheY-like chemotaxis protein
VRPRIFLADDHPAVLKATTALLKPQFDIVGSAMDGATLVSEVLRLYPDVIVADITMPILSGIDAVHRLRDSVLLAKIVFLTVHSDQQFGSMHGRGRTGICPQGPHEDPPDSSNTSGPCRAILHLSIY